MAKRLRAEDRRQRILEAAIKCFATDGYRGTTTAQLARTARVTEPILYRHFRSKHDLFLAMLDLASRVAMQMFQSVIGAIHSPIERLRALLRLNPAITDPRMTEIYRVIFHAQSEHTEPRIQSAIRQHYRRYAEFLTLLISNAQRAGQIRADLSAEGLAWQIIQAAVGYAMVKPLEIPGHASREAVEQAMALLIEQISASPNPRVTAVALPGAISRRRARRRRTRR